MKKLKLFFALFAMLALGVTNAWAETATLTFSAKCGGKGTDTQGYNWTITSDGTESTFDNTKGIHYGTNSAKVQYIRLSTSDIPGTITEVKVNASTASSVTANLTVKVGSSDFTTGNSVTSQTLSTSATEYTFSGSASGEIIVEISKASSATKAIYCKSVVVTYKTSGSEEPAASLTANPTSLDFGNVTQNNEVEAKTFTISGSDFTTGELTITAPSGYTVNPTTVSVDGTLGETTITVTPNTSNVGTFNGNVTISGANLNSSVNVALSMTVEKAPATPTENVYVKVTSTAGITDGEYLIVYETGNVAFDGSLATLDVEGNMIEAQISSNTIAGNTEIDAATFTIASMTGGHSILSKSGKYIGRTSGSNGMNTGNSAIANVITFSNGAVKVAGSGSGASASLQYFAQSGSERFRYYTSVQKAIALYKKASKHTVTIADCTNGTVSAKMGETALATNDQVLSGIQITLSNEAATGYKLAAYDVYKTGDNTTKVTVTDGKFIMPEFDVTISATFVPAKTLTSIEITSAATQTTFWQGETFNSTGLKVIAHFDGAADEDVTDKVTVTGSTATAGAAVEVTVSFTEGTVTRTATYTITVKDIPNTKETAYTVADAYDIIDILTTADGVYIKGIVSQVDEYLSNYKSITYWISDDGTTTKQLQAYSGKGLEGADFVDITGVSVEDQVIVCGNLKKHTDGTYEFNYNNYLVSQIKTTKADPELSYTTTEYNVNLGDEFTAPTLNNLHSLAVTYSSNDEDVATVAVDGAVTIKAAGTVVITASFAGNEDYVAGEASYTINITDPNVSSVTFDAAVDIPTEGLTLTKNGVSMTFTGGAMDNGENYRCYSGQKMTISYADGNITKIVLECTTNNDAKYGPGCFETETASYSYSGKVGTWTGEAKSITFNAKDQVRMTTVTVYYKQDTRTPAGIAWNPATVSLTVGDAFTPPTFSNPNSVTGITFASDNEALATVNAGVISLVSGKTGTATITATYAGNETYKPAEVTCVITVSPKSEKVVILAQYGDQWYALKAAYLSGKTDRLDAVHVDYFNGTLYNVTEEVKATIEWNSIVEGDKVSFLNDGKYLKGESSTKLLFEAGEDGLYQWDNTTYTMTIGTTVRSFLYNGEAFRNFATSNAGQTKDGITYSSLPVVTTPVYSTEEFVSVYTRPELPVGSYGTICLPYAVNNYTGATFYEVAGKEGNKIVFDEVTELEAGKPYIFMAEAAEIKLAQVGEEYTGSAKLHNSLQGTFNQIDPAETNALTDNYIMYNNIIKKCGANCGLQAYRAYFVASKLESLGIPSAQMPGRSRVTMGVTGENEATGVDNITENGAIAPALQGTYDIMGRQLAEPTTSGFYIINGKKVFVVK